MSPAPGRARHHMGFGFITFGDPASVDKVLAQPTHELDGKKAFSMHEKFPAVMSVGGEVPQLGHQKPAGMVVQWNKVASEARWS
ncbi:hypothetical protein KGM_213033 [Danaus plexippus plexippus]|uniref:Uncharacterized protein n=1 Tax=Danaus plexippus plexippus TaxID=278856 RepID=A0A212F0X3_DANPL|nr:hypothetical protein KGM_213033 [Danaus plexippus plexippus]